MQNFNKTIIFLRILFMICNICPRKCNVDLNNNKGFCGKVGNKIKIAKVMRHFWEEPIISGKNGSGAIFFSNCNLKCVYCQNYQISHLGNGRDFTGEELAQLFKKLETSGVENINLVTPTHYATQILQALKLYKPKIPVVWNSSGYDSSEMLEELKDYVDIFLFDFKYFSSKKACEYSNAPNYYEICLNSLITANKLVPQNVIENGIMKKGIIIRHLVLPNMSDDSIKIFDEIKKLLGNNIYISVMSQYIPFYKACEMPELNTTTKPLEYKKVVSHIKKLGFKNGFLQEASSADCAYTPNFEDNAFFEL